MGDCKQNKLANAKGKWNKYLRVSGICILLKMSIRLSTSTKGPVKQLGGGSSVQRWAAEGGKGNAPPVTILLKIRHKIANTTYTPLQIFGAQGSKMLWKNNSLIALMRKTLFTQGI